MIRLVQSIWPNVTQVHLIVGVFGLFVFFIFAFAVLYYFLYKSQTARFWVASEIAAKQAKDTMTRLQMEISTLSSESAAIAQVHAALESGIMKDVPAVLPSGYRVEGGSYHDRSLDGHEEEGVWLTIYAQDGSSLCRLDESEYHEITPKYLTAWLGEALAQRVARR